MPPRRQAIPLDFSKEELGDEDTKMAQEYGVIFLLRRYAEVSSVSGIPQIQRSTSAFRIIFWTLVVLGGTGTLTWQIYIAVAKYLNYEVSTNVVRRTNSSMEFPSVTICNQNPIDNKKITNFTDISELLEAWNLSTSAKPAQAKKNKKKSPNINGMGERPPDQNFQRQLIIQNKMAALNPEQKRFVGSAIEDMLLSCFYNNFECNESDFSYFYNYQYGNCFVFNMMNGKNALRTLEIGSQYGLKLTLYINSNSYIMTSVYSGVRVLVHHPTEYPFPEDVGIQVAPGKLTSVGLGLTVGSIYEPPYGECTTLSKDYQRRLSAYVDLLPNISYSKEGCLKTCLQKQIIANCNCHNPFLPYLSNITAYRNISRRNTRRCNITDESDDMACVETVKVSIMNNSLDCSYCTLACRKYTYSTTISQCNWPSDVAMASIALSLNSTPAMKKGRTVDSTLIANQILALEIYYDSFTYLEISEQPAYVLFSLISDLGGQVGLWLGLSVAALFEVFELIYDALVSIVEMITIRVKKNRSKRKIDNNTKPVLEKC